MSIERHKSILVIPDLHCPYHHPDSVAFLSALKEKFSPTRVICLGDETDGHKISYHESEQSLPHSASGELRAAIYALFKNVDVMHSNHGSLVYRKGKTAQLPPEVFKGYNDIYQAPKGWVWTKDLTLTLPSGQDCFFYHGKIANALKLSQALGMCTVNGHYHGQFSIQKWRAGRHTNWAMVSGCLVDPSSPAFAYGENHTFKPIIGASLIINSQPRLEPMLLDRGGRWTGKLTK
jgi:hypothetical protein